MTSLWNVLLDSWTTRLRYQHYILVRFFYSKIVKHSNKILIILYNLLKFHWLKTKKKVFSMCFDTFWRQLEWGKRSKIMDENLDERWKLVLRCKHSDSQSCSDHIQYTLFLVTLSSWWIPPLSPPSLHQLITFLLLFIGITDFRILSPL